MGKGESGVGGGLETINTGRALRTGRNMSFKSSPHHHAPAPLRLSMEGKRARSERRGRSLKNARGSSRAMGLSFA